MFKTPYYVFDADLLTTRIGMVREMLGAMELTYSMKANAFLLKNAAAGMSHVEVCSPGELEICRAEGIPPEKVIYSGVVKERTDIREAIRWGAGILTAESLRQIALISEEAAEAGQEVQVLARLSSGNQFGMDIGDLGKILAHRKSYPAVHLLGFHYYSGTQKKKPEAVQKDLDRLGEAIDSLRERFGFVPEMIEYGPGLAADYFGPEPDETERNLLEAVSEMIRAFRYPMGVEMGRFLAAPCGEYHTRILDLKRTDGVNYALMDGGIHHLRYYGQMMAVNIPPLRQVPERAGAREPYCLCGSLCTAADVLARGAKLFPLETGDELIFGRCGAYSVSEASALFLSRDLPEVWLKQGGAERLLRAGKATWPLNTAEDQVR